MKKNSKKYYSVYINWKCKMLKTYPLVVIVSQTTYRLTQKELEPTPVSMHVVNTEVPGRCKLSVCTLNAHI